MAINYSERINFINDENPISNYSHLRGLPDTCPICSFAVSPEYILIHHKNRRNSELLCGLS
ncbi:hypothetical protein [Priestia aryabhattai]|uniref:hypothetical protein n=1 Tax=Priestia aryabhattai TaxID=412384 RepID=UPI003D2924A1